MLSTPLKAFLGVLGSVVVIGGVGYVSGVFDRFISAPPAQIAAIPPQSAPDSKPEQPASVTTPTQAKPNVPSQDKPADAPVATDPAKPETAKAEIVPPTFDILRVEPDGSIVIAGKAPGGANVEVLAGSKVIGQAVAGPEGDFAVVVADPLAPGSYQIVLRATDEDNSIAMSTETAVVSIPEKPDGQVLALVEQPGQPSKLITVPEPMVAKPAEPATPEPQKPAETAAVAPPQPAEPAAAPKPSAPETPAAVPAKPEEKPTEVAVAKPEPVQSTPAPAPDLRVEVKAIEIEGNKVFVAGVATPKKPVRAYANELMLGEARSSGTGEFLIEALVDLPVGDYIVRADLLADEGDKVLMRAQVPFRREAGEAVAAVAPEPKPAAPAQQPATATSGASTEPPAQATAPAPAQATTPAPAQTAAQPASAAETASSPAVSAVTQPSAEAAAEPSAKPEQQASAEPPSVTAAPLQSVDGAVIIRRGDTLWRISRRVYGRGVRYSTIYLANQSQISDPDRIWPGQVFSVPVKTSEGESADMEAIADQKAAPEEVGKTTVR